MRPTEDDDIPEDEQSMDAGGAPIFEEPTEVQSKE